MKAAVAVREGGREDRTFVLDLGRRTAMDSVSDLRSPLPSLVQTSYERLVDYVLDQSCVTFVAEAAGAPVGFLLMLDSLPDEVTLLPQAFIAYMAVEPHARRRRVACRLLDAAEEAARQRKLPHLALMVTEENAPARELYAQAGFVTERRLLCKTL